ncbi:hypothetical protein [Variovorax saccharolyticus]|uniref:hypothetical protein n=1 Tax=Variovorax saccharolyticus TaxID=3053516 RepID=UPI00257769D5|nr:hypothetical protein [Variovorax sp. J31P216]MDM0029098.1 hypothetical protein [Variovorax sp. J31P216]
MPKTMETMDRAPRGNEQAGIDWWSAQSEQLRAYWLKHAEAFDPSAAGAWAAFKTAHDASERWADQDPVRMHSGLEFRGFEFSLQVYPGDDGWLGVQVIAQPPATGFNEGCTVGGDGAGRLRFGVNARIGAATLEWFAQDPHVPLYLEGLRLVLQPHQCEQLRTWLPRLGQTAVLAQRLATALNRRMGGDAPTLHYMNDFASGLAACVVLDGQDAVTAIASQLATHWAAKDAGLRTALQGPEIAALLETGRFAREQGATS